jgi:hypothetical protein
VVRTLSVLLVCAFILSAAAVSAHVPCSASGNDSIGTALAVSDPLKSWVFYDEVTLSSSVRYYAMDMRAGQRLRLMALTPEGAPFAPSIAVMGAGVDGGPAVPDGVELPPEGEGAYVALGIREGFSYEPFTPAAYAQTAEVDLVVPLDGLVYVAVFDMEHPGKVALAVGYEERFTPLDIVRVPLDAVGIHRWEGWSLLGMLLPIALGAAAVAWAALRRICTVRMTTCVFLYTTVSAAYAGSAGFFAWAALRALRSSGWDPLFLVSLLFAALPAGLAALAFRRGRRCGVSPRRGDRAALAALGAAGLAVWAGWVVVPLVALAGSVLPPSVLGRTLLERGG